MNDESFLDEVLANAMERLSAGDRIAVEDYLKSHPHLRDEIERLLAVAQEVSVVRPEPFPQFSDYEIVEQIGSGAMGRVYLAKQKSLADRFVAVKVASLPTFASGRSKQRFLNEARALARVQHQNVVAVYDVLDEARSIAYVMEWIRGTTLARLLGALRRGDSDFLESVFEDAPLRPRDPNALFFCRVGSQIARALDHIHSLGLIHRDVKPSNILLREDGSALLADFGLVLDQCSSMTRSGTFVGSPEFASPEQLCGVRRNLDGRSDIYSLGVTLYQALTLQRPYEGKSPVEISQDIEAGRFVPIRRRNPKIPRDLETVIQKAMAPDPVERYASAQLFHEDLERIIHLKPILARRPNFFRRCWKLLQRNRVLFLAAAVGGLLVLVFLGFLWFRLEARRSIPARVNSLIREARLTLLDSSEGERVFQGAMQDSTKNRRFDPQRALRLYKQAQRLRYDKAIAIEESTIRLWLETQLAQSPPERFITSYPCPLTLEYAKSVQSGEVRLYSENELGNATEDDRRALGLFAFLQGDSKSSLRAWRSLLRPIGSDALMDASIGELYLTLDRPELAFPRLLSASQSFQDAGFLWVDAADAALRIEDVSEGQRLLNRAEKCELHDPYGSLKRVRADYLSHIGQRKEAEAIYEELCLSHRVPTLRLHYARFLERKGEPIRALEVLLPVAKRDYSTTRYRDATLGIANRWWSRLDGSEKSRRLLDLLEQEPKLSPDLHWILNQTGQTLHLQEKEESSSSLSLKSSHRRQFRSLESLANRWECVLMNLDKARVSPGLFKKCFVMMGLDARSPMPHRRLIDIGSAIHHNYGVLKKIVLSGLGALAVVLPEPVEGQTVMPGWSLEIYAPDTSSLNSGSEALDFDSTQRILYSKSLTTPGGVGVELAKIAAGNVVFSHFFSNFSQSHGSGILLRGDELLLADIGNVSGTGSRIVSVDLNTFSESTFYSLPWSLNPNSNGSGQVRFARNPARPNSLFFWDSTTASVHHLDSSSGTNLTRLYTVYDGMPDGDHSVSLRHNDLVFDEGTGMLLLSEGFSGEIIEIDPDAGTSRSVISVIGSPSALTLDRTGKRLFVISDRSLWVVDRNGGAIKPILFGLSDFALDIRLGSQANPGLSSNSATVLIAQWNSDIILALKERP